jgi:hypothetical protein
MLDVHDPNNVLPDEDFSEAARRFPPLARLVESLERIEATGRDRDDLEEVLKALLRFFVRLPHGDGVGLGVDVLHELMLDLHDVDRGHLPKALTPEKRIGNASTDMREIHQADRLAAAHAFRVGVCKAAKPEKSRGWVKAANDQIARDLAEAGLISPDTDKIAKLVAYRPDASRKNQAYDMLSHPIESEDQYRAEIERIARRCVLDLST